MVITGINKKKEGIDKLIIDINDVKKDVVYIRSALDKEQERMDEILEILDSLDV